MSKRPLGREGDVSHMRISIIVIPICPIIEGIAYDHLMRRAFKTDSGILFGIALVAPLSNRTTCALKLGGAWSAGKAHSAFILRFAYQHKFDVC